MLFGLDQFLLFLKQTRFIKNKDVQLTFHLNCLLVGYVIVASLSTNINVSFVC